MMSARYSFGEEVVFAEEEGEMYDRFVYLYIAPRTARKADGRKREKPQVFGRH